jgi:hypothetical protein
VAWHAAVPPHARPDSPSSVSTPKLASAHQPHPIFIVQFRSHVPWEPLFAIGRSFLVAGMRGPANRQWCDRHWNASLAELILHLWPMSLAVTHRHLPDSAGVPADRMLSNRRQTTTADRAPWTGALFAGCVDDRHTARLSDFDDRIRDRNTTGLREIFFGRQARPSGCSTSPSTLR